MLGLGANSVRLLMDGEEEKTSLIITSEDADDEDSPDQEEEEGRTGAKEKQSESFTVVEFYSIDFYHGNRSNTVKLPHTVESVRTVSLDILAPPPEA